jgi:pimeloyl-ACP methyl ester carboxylesterase
MPTIVLVHGAWHSPKHFDPTTKVLVSHGYKVVGVDCPSTNDTQTLNTFEDDCEAVRSAVLQELETADVLVAAHSYGGAVATSALQGLSLAARSASGHATSVIGIAYICAAVLPAGISFLDALGGNPVAIHDLSANDGFVRVSSPPGPEHYFYHDLSEEEAKHWASLLRPQSWVAVTSGVVTSEACMEIPAHYLLCSEDRAIAIEVQKGMVAGAEGRSGKSFRTEELECSHSPFLSEPEKTAGFLRRSAGEAC